MRVYGYPPLKEGDKFVYIGPIEDLLGKYAVISYIGIFDIYVSMPENGRFAYRADLFHKFFKRALK